jgi:hypothetical protein
MWNLRPLKDEGENLGITAAPRKIEEAPPGHNVHDLERTHAILFFHNYTVLLF